MSNYLQHWTAAHQAPPSFTISQLHHLPESGQTHVHWVSDAIEPSHPLLPPSPFVFNCSQNQSFPMSWLFTSGNQSIIGTSPSILPMNIQGWFSLGLTGLISLLSNRFSSLLQHHSSKASILWHSAFFTVHLSHLYMAPGKPQLLLHELLSAKWCLCFLICCLDLLEVFFQGANIF